MTTKADSARNHHLMRAYMRMADNMTQAERRAWTFLRHEICSIADNMADLSSFKSIPVPEDRARRLKELTNLLPIIGEDYVAFATPAETRSDSSHLTMRSH